MYRHVILEWTSNGKVCEEEKLVIYTMVHVGATVRMDNRDYKVVAITMLDELLVGIEDDRLVPKISLERILGG